MEKDQKIEEIQNEYQTKIKELHQKYQNRLFLERIFFITIIILILGLNFYRNHQNLKILQKDTQQNEIILDITPSNKPIQLHILNQPDHITPKHFINFLNQNRDSLEFVENSSDSILIGIMALSSRITESIDKEKILSLIKGKKKVGFAFIRIASSCKGLSSYKSEIQNFINRLQLNLPIEGFELVASINSRIFSCHKNINNLIKFFR